MRDGCCRLGPESTSEFVLVATDIAEFEVLKLPSMMKRAIVGRANAFEDNYSCKPSAVQIQQ